MKYAATAPYMPTPGTAGRMPRQMTLRPAIGASHRPDRASAEGASGPASRRIPTKAAIGTSTPTAAASANKDDGGSTNRYSMAPSCWTGTNVLEATMVKQADDAHAARSHHIERPHSITLD